MTKEVNIKMQRAVEITNFDNTGKVLAAEKKLLDSFVQNKKPVLDKHGKDITGRDAVAQISMAMFVVIQHLDGRIKELEKLNAKEE